MKHINCEHVQDVLPELLGNRLEQLEAEAVHAHVQHCGDCRDELTFAAAVAGARLAVPAGLEERLRLAVHVRPARRHWHVAMAASVAVAVIGGSAVLSMLRHEPSAAPSEQTANTEDQGAGWFSVDDAFVSGAASLGDLSVEELQKLLVELDS